MIYFTKDTGSQAIKIGYSRKPIKRLGGLQTGNPHKLILLGSVAGTLDDEASFHSKFAQHRLEGEWFKGEIIEEVLSIISAYKEQRLAMRRQTVADATGKDMANGEPVPDLTGNGTLDKDSGIEGVSKIPGLKMKRLSLKLTERPYEQKKDPDFQKGCVYCGGEIVYLLEFEADLTDASALNQLRHALFAAPQNPPPALRHVFLDEDNAVIPFSPTITDHHIVGDREAVTGGQGEAFRGLVAWEKSLDPNHRDVKVKGMFMGANYTGEHPLKKAKKLIVSIR